MCYAYLRSKNFESGNVHLIWLHLSENKALPVLCLNNIRFLTPYWVLRVFNMVYKDSVELDQLSFLYIWMGGNVDSEMESM